MPLNQLDRWKLTISILIAEIEESPYPLLDGVHDHLLHARASLNNMRLLELQNATPDTSDDNDDNG